MDPHNEKPDIREYHRQCKITLTSVCSRMKSAFSFYCTFFLVFSLLVVKLTFKFSLFILKTICSIFRKHSLTLFFICHLQNMNEVIQLTNFRGVKHFGLYRKTFLKPRPVRKISQSIVCDCLRVFSMLTKN